MPDDQTAEVQDTDAHDESADVEALDVSAEQDDASQDDAEKTYSESYVKKLRTENANRRTKLNEAETELERLKAIETKFKKLEQAQMTEEERKNADLEAATQRASELEAQLAKAEQAMRETTTTNALRDALAEPDAGVADVRAALRLLDRSQLELDDDGNPDAESVKTAIEAMLDAYPILQAKKSASTGNPANPRRTEVDVKETAQQQRDRIQGHTGYHMFDPNHAKAHGGGVIGKEIEITGG